MASSAVGSQSDRIPRTPLVLSEQDNRCTQNGAFVYEPLQAGQIRLLRVISCNDSRAECELRHVNLDTDEEWNALSYVWGDAAPNREIVIDGKALAIRANLLAALQALQSVQPELGNHLVWIWIDAVSINQNDGLEKSEQVRNMHHIYSSATSVLIWLGDENECPPVVVEALLWMDADDQYNKYLARAEESAPVRTPEVRELAPNDVASVVTQKADENISAWYRQRERTLARLEILGVSPQQIAALRDLHMALKSITRVTKKAYRESIAALLESSSFTADLFPPDHPFWGAFIDFATNRWHLRVWTIQESECAKQLYLLTPYGFVSWRFIESATKLILDFNISDKIISREHLFAPEVISRKERWDKISLQKDIPMPRSLVALLLKAGTRQATLNKDYVYGILALVDQDTLSNVVVDYSATDAKIFANAVKEALRPKGYAQILPALWQINPIASPRVHNFPSWCPDLTNTDFDRNKSVVTDSDIVDAEVREKYIGHARVDLWAGETVLGFTAHRLDRVLRCADKTIMSARWSWLYSNDVQRIIAPMLHFYFTVEQQEFIHCLQSTFGTVDGGIEPRVANNLRLTPIDDTKSNVAGWESLLRFNDAVRRHSGSVGEAMRELGWQDSSEAFHCMYTLFRNHYGQFHFETVSGKIGFAWQYASPGDHIVYVPGGSSLHVVSEDGKTYKGCAYVHGFMGDSLPGVLPESQDDWEMFYVS